MFYFKIILFYPVHTLGLNITVFRPRPLLVCPFLCKAFHLVTFPSHPLGCCALTPVAMRLICPAPLCLFTFWCPLSLWLPFRRCYFVYLTRHVCVCAPRLRGSSAFLLTLLHTHTHTHRVTLPSLSPSLPSLCNISVSLFQTVPMSLTVPHLCRCLFLDHSNLVSCRRPPSSLSAPLLLSSPSKGLATTIGSLTLRVCQWSHSAVCLGFGRAGKSQPQEAVRLLFPGEVIKGRQAGPCVCRQNYVGG